MLKRKIGSIGESYICNWLKDLGFTVEERNFYSSYSEIDIVISSLDCNSNYEEKAFSFVEVKLRSNLMFCDGVYSVNKIKKLNLIKAANLWIAKRGYKDGQINQFYGIILDRVSTTKFRDKRRYIYVKELSSWFKVRVYNLFA